MLYYFIVVESALIQNPLSCDQHAFRRGYSTDSRLSTMVEYAESAIIQNKFALGVFLDIQGAFDNVSVDTVIVGMKNKKIPEVFINWYCSYHKYRTVTVNHEGVKVKRFLTLAPSMEYSLWKFTTNFLERPSKNMWFRRWCMPHSNGRESPPSPFSHARGHWQGACVGKE